MCVYTCSLLATKEPALGHVPVITFFDVATVIELRVMTFSTRWGDWTGCSGLGKAANPVKGGSLFIFQQWGMGSLSIFTCT